MATPVEQVGETVARAAAAQAAAVKAAVRAIIRALKTGDRDKAKATANRQRKAVLAASHDRGAAVARKVVAAYGLPMSKPAERGRSVVRQRDSMELNDAIDKIIDHTEEHDDTGLDDFELDDFELDDPEIRPIEDLLESEAQSVYEKSIITTTKRELAQGGVVGARRVIHPEASAGGTCGLCVAAATRQYKTSQLKPIHDRCKCTVLPIIKVGRHEIDPGNDVNYSDIDLDKAYKQLEGSTRSKLSNQRFVPGDDGKLRRKVDESKHRTVDDEKRLLADGRRVSVTPPDENGSYTRPRDYKGEETDPVFDFALAEKVIRGIIGDQGKPVGGHGYGHTPVGKHNREFPKSWGDDEIAAAFYECLQYGNRISDGASVTITCTVNEVECVLEFNLMSRRAEESVMFRPEKGPGVVDVTWVRGRRKERPKE